MQLTITFDETYGTIETKIGFKSLPFKRIDLLALQASATILHLT